MRVLSGAGRCWRSSKPSVQSTQMCGAKCEAHPPQSRQRQAPPAAARKELRQAGEAVPHPPLLCLLSAAAERAAPRQVSRRGRNRRAHCAFMSNLSWPAAPIRPHNLRPDGRSGLERSSQPTQKGDGMITLEEATDAVVTPREGDSTRRKKKWEEESPSKKERAFTVEIPGVRAELNAFLEKYPQYKPRYVEETVRSVGAAAAKGAITGKIATIMAAKSEL